VLPRCFGNLKTASVDREAAKRAKPEHVIANEKDLNRT
jgi:hypothetical protein